MFAKGGLAYDLGLLFALGLVAANYQAFNTLAQTAFSGIGGIGATIQGRGPASYAGTSTISGANTSGINLFNFGSSSGASWAS
jgi:hypothetical protein